MFVGIQLLAGIGLRDTGQWGSDRLDIFQKGTDQVQLQVGICRPGNDLKGIGQSSRMQGSGHQGTGLVGLGTGRRQGTYRRRDSGLRLQGTDPDPDLGPCPCPDLYRHCYYHLEKFQ